MNYLRWWEHSADMPPVMFTVNAAGKTLHKILQAIGVEVGCLLGNVVV